MRLFIVNMFRGSAIETHMYTLGVYSNYREAINAKVTEELRTDDRFIGHVEEFVLNVMAPEDRAKSTYESALSRHSIPIDVNRH